MRIRAASRVAVTPVSLGVTPVAPSHESMLKYLGGGLTDFGLVPARPVDSFGLGLNCTWLTQGASATAFYPGTDPQDVPSLRPSQLMSQCYYQMKQSNGWFF
jgi:hypothetical protein